MENFTRKEKEDLYKKNQTSLQRRWKNPISSSDFDDLPEWTDEQLDKSLKDTIGQLRFERTASWIWKVIIAVFVVWGVVGFLSQDQETQEKRLINGVIIFASGFGLSWLYELKRTSQETNKLLRELLTRK